jgi:hypothetical protein
MTNKRIFLNITSRAALLALPLAWVAGTAMPATCHAAAPTTQLASKDAIGQQLIANEKASWDLAIRHEAAAYKALHAPDFMTVTGSGVVDKANSETSAMDPNVHFDQCDLSGFDIRYVAGNAALLTYHVKATGLDHGKPFQLESYASSLWMKRDGKWLNVFYQATPAPAR